ncbi:MAG TPA: YfhO family protein, partial [Thermoanaerobaculia bacterium]
DLVLSADAPMRVFVATSLPDWPGWTAQTESGTALPLQTINHAFVGLWIPSGHSDVRLSYRPASFRLGMWLFAAGFAVAAATVFLRSSRRIPR